MGVNGLIRLLREEGWLPAEASCSPTLWRDASSSFLSTRSAAHRMQQLPPHSTLALDGNGLAFYLQRMAYARHFESIVDNKKAKPPQPSGAPSSFVCGCPRKASLTESQVTQLLPQFMPLHMLEQVTTEFVTSLQNSQMNLVIYWDGKRRRMKADTTQARRTTQHDKWSRLEQYCVHGVLSTGTNKKTGKNQRLCQRDMLSNFPNGSLLLEQVRSTLSKIGNVAMIDCEEEADIEVARASAINPTTFCVGMDSDYCLFPSCKYVPLDTLNASGRVVSGCVLARSDIAEHFELPTDEAMVEMAILLGNDYIGNASEAKLDFKGSRFDPVAIMDHLRDQPADYRVTSTSPETQDALDFVRTLYSFGDLTIFPFDCEETESKDDASIENSTVDPHRPHLPAEIDLDLLTLGPLEFSVMDAILRPLQLYVDSSKSSDEPPILDTEHLEAFRKVGFALESHTAPAYESVSRPDWRDVMAIYMLERMVAFLFDDNQTAPAIKLTSPAKLSDHSLFHSILQTKRRLTQSTSLIPLQVTGIMEAPPVERTTLPIDEHEDAILDAVESQRVTIIHGETGCGKSSRVPVMLLRSPLPPESPLTEVKMFISQPRRIAAKSLVERVRTCEPDLKDSIALRMGHGVREYESSKTKAWFVTTGYLVRLLANHPAKFDDVSHLIIDEVHERSVDTDILCLLCRRLLQSNSTIRLILMSATMAAALYQDYFTARPPIHVGARRFPIKEHFVEDLIKSFRLPPADMKAAKDIATDCAKKRCSGPPSTRYMENLVRLAVRTTVSVGQPGASVLIFVPGMNEIISAIDLIDKVYAPGIRYTCFPIHSDIPFEDQMSAFDRPDKDEVKVVIATNAAESSVTLPNVDHVICLGLCKQIVYNPSSHRQMLMPAWISRASATQRAGRTGRVRPGNVYRLYTRETYDEHMDSFEMGEILRIPLDSVILTLKEMLNEAATPVLLDCLDAPDLSAIDRSFQSLCRSNFISAPNDDGKITNLGAFVSSLGIDLMLGSLIGLGIQFGVGAEAIEMAAVLSFPKSPWAITSPLYHEPATFNEITAKTYTSKSHFDSNLYSDALSIMNLLWDYERARNQSGWAYHYCVSGPRMKRLMTTRNSLRNRVADFIGTHGDRLRIREPPVNMPHAKVTLLRVIQVWVFSDTMISSIQATSTKDGTISLGLAGSVIEQSHLTQVLDPSRHSFQLICSREINQSGSFEPATAEGVFDMMAFLPNFEGRFLSFVVDKEYDIAWYTTESELCFFAREDVIEWETFERFRKLRLSQLEETKILAFEESGNSRRGIKERACGRWLIKQRKEAPDAMTKEDVVLFRKWSTKEVKKLNRHLRRNGANLGEIKRSIYCSFTTPGKKGKKLPTFSLESRGQCTEVSRVDLADLVGTSNLNVSSYEKSRSSQTITFFPVEKTPLTAFENPHVTTGSGLESSWHRPLLNDIPEGARILSVLASGRRKDHAIHIPASSVEDRGGATDEKKEEMDVIQVALDKGQTKISQRWTQFGSNKAVFVEENSIPASSVCVNGPIEVFACCANTLDIRGGALKVEGLTLLPPGRLFVLLAFLTFGLHPYAPDDDVDDTAGPQRERTLAHAERWLGEWERLVAEIGMECSRPVGDIRVKERLQEALAFHNSCDHMGEELVCHPDKVKALCTIFDRTDGYSTSVWESLHDDPFTIENLKKHKSIGYDKSVSSPDRSDVNVCQTSRNAQDSEAVEKDCRVPNEAGHSKQVVNSLNLVNLKKDTVRHPKGSPRSATIISSFSAETLLASKPLFATRLQPGVALDAYNLPSSNILCCLLNHYRTVFLKKRDKKGDLRMKLERYKGMSLSPQFWSIYVHKNKSTGTKWYFAHFVCDWIPPVPVRNRETVAPGWAQGGYNRPMKVKDALLCVPPQFRNTPYKSGEFVLCASQGPKKMMFFNSIEMAIRMEAAFWLERQYGGVDKHWYMHQLEELMGMVVKYS